jgi:starch-binding outer membrane protein, SusD/RagB family
MKRLLIFLMIITSVGALYSCRKMLDIQPNDRLLENAVFSDRNAIYGVLNGIYTQMGDADSYGNGLTMTVTDLLAQYYSTYPRSYSELVKGSYNNTTVTALTDPIWLKSYNLILQNNILLGHVSRDKNNGLSEADRQIILGESYAIRAFLHFDLVRLFGPVYAIDSTSKTIPYNTDEKQRVQTMLPAREVLQRVWQDLDSAALLLKNDPVITNGVANVISTVMADNFMQRRNLRLNYFAVRALQARVALYTGNKATALQMAIEVITRGQKIFPWSPAEASLVGGPGQDLVFSSENIFALFNSKLYTYYLSLFAPVLTDYTILKPDEKGLLTFYDKNINDFRYRGWWRLDPAAAQKTKTFIKYMQPGDSSAVSKYMQPLIRISEMYYIAAETSTDPMEGLNYLNTVRARRGLVAVTNPADLPEAIAKEYRREFWGEGQLFFFYKRKNSTLVPTTAGTATTTTFTPQRYTIPLPLSEVLNR